MLAINLKKLIQLPIIFMSVSSLSIGLNPKSATAAPSQCEFLVGENYTNLHGGNQGILTISSNSNAEGNGTLVNIFSGFWKIGGSAMEGQPVTVQTAGSMFLMIRDMGEIKQVWAGTCESDGFARGIIYDPSIPRARTSFTVKSR
jgi:hypothetical protein